MSKHLDGELSTQELAAMSDEDSDFSDIPELGDEFWKNARLVEPDQTTPVTLRIKRSVLEAFKSQGRGYQTRMKAGAGILCTHIEKVNLPRASRHPTSR